MFRLSRTSVIAWTAVVAVIAALSYALTGVAVPPAAAEDKAKKAAPPLVEFTADGKLKRPVGYRTRADDPMKGWTFTGRTQATEEEVMARVTGQLTRIAVRVGDAVNKGDLLAEIDPRAYRLDLDAARARQKVAEAKLQLAKLNIASTKMLTEAKVVSQEELVE